MLTAGLAATWMQRNWQQLAPARLHPALAVRSRSAWRARSPSCAGHVDAFLGSLPATSAAAASWDAPLVRQNEALLVPTQVRGRHAPLAAPNCFQAYRPACSLSWLLAWPVQGARLPPHPLDTRHAALRHPPQVNYVCKAANLYEDAGYKVRRPACGCTQAGPADSSVAASPRLPHRACAAPHAAGRPAPSPAAVWHQLRDQQVAQHQLAVGQVWLPADGHEWGCPLARLRHVCAC